MKTVITELLGIEYPVIQGGMAWVGTAELAAAVSEAGGLGIIGAGGAPASWVEDQIHKVKEKTDKPFGVNFSKFIFCQCTFPCSSVICKFSCCHNSSTSISILIHIAITCNCKSTKNDSKYQCQSDCKYINFL